ncbi:MAG: hypothetical protein SCM11_07790 [Bacillota bacterium]|nr:hypothetical protein [Bacillota bacterium]
MSLKIGIKWNESTRFTDNVTMKNIIKLTSYGQYNQTPTYHTNTAFTKDGRSLVFASARGNKSYIIRADVRSGDLIALYEAEGVGSRDYMHTFDYAEIGNGRGVCGNRLALAPQTGWAVFTHDKALLAVQIDTAVVRTLISDIGDEWVYGAPSISWDGTIIVVPISSAHPQIIHNERLYKRYIDYDNHSMKLLYISLTDGQIKEILSIKSCQCSHAAFCPTDHDLIYYDRNIPPRYWCGNDGGKTSRIWLYRVSTGKTWPLRTSYPGVFQVHAAWTWAGDAIAYHGFMRAEGYSSGIYIGLTNKNSLPIRDYQFPHVHSYGHLNPDPVRPALILDGDLMPGCLSWLFYDDVVPRIELICRHDTQWESMPGQYSHPHPQSDAAGKYICYNKAESGRSDVLVVEI